MQEIGFRLSRPCRKNSCRRTATDPSKMEDDHRTSEILNLWSGVGPRTTQGPMKCSIMNVSIEGSWSV